MNTPSRSTPVRLNAGIDPVKMAKAKFAGITDDAQAWWDCNNDKARHDQLREWNGRYPTGAESYDWAALPKAMREAFAKWLTTGQGEGWGFSAPAAEPKRPAPNVTCSTGNGQRSVKLAGGVGMPFWVVALSDAGEVEAFGPFANQEEAEHDKQKLKIGGYSKVAIARCNSKAEAKIRGEGAWFINDKVRPAVKKHRGFSALETSGNRSSETVPSAKFVGGEDVTDYSGIRRAIKNWLSRNSTSSPRKIRDGVAAGGAFDEASIAVVIKEMHRNGEIVLNDGNSGAGKRQYVNAQAAKFAGGAAKWWDFASPEDRAHVLREMDGGYGMSLKYAEWKKINPEVRQEIETWMAAHKDELNSREFSAQVDAGATLPNTIRPAPKLQATDPSVTYTVRWSNTRGDRLEAPGLSETAAYAKAELLDQAGYERITVLPDTLSHVKIR